MNGAPVAPTINNLPGALELLKHGWAVFPCHFPKDGGCSCGKECSSPAKHPRTSQGFKDASKAPDVVRNWWWGTPAANVGVATGAVSGIVVIDVDPRHGGDVTLAALEVDHGPLPETVEAATGGGGGRHLYFAHPGGEIRNDAGKKLGPGLDIRGDGGYCIAPPSIHSSQRRYEWIRAPGDTSLAPLPGWMLERLTATPSRPSPDTPTPANGAIVEGQRNVMLASLAGSMRRRGMSQQAIAAALLQENKLCVVPLGEEEVMAIAASVARYAPTPSPNSEAAAQPVPLADLLDILDEVVWFIRRYVVLNAVQADALALWEAHAHAVQAADTTAYLSIRSPEKRSGKTLLLELLEILVPSPLKADNISVAALARMVADGATLLLDEVDSLFGKGKASETQEMLRGVLNGGFRRGGCYVRMVGQGAAQQPQRFSTFGAKVLAGIGGLPGTLDDRSIIIEMRRKAPGETVARFRYRAARAEAAPIRERLAAWASAAIDTLRDARPEIPGALDDRAADAWESLLGIADLAGGDWPQRARAAAIALSTGENREDPSLGVKLLDDIRTTFATRGVDRMLSRDLVAALVAIEESPWGDIRGRPLDARGLAARLRPHRVKPVQVRVGDATGKGYQHEDLADAWKRYLPSPPEQGKQGKQGKHEPVGGVSPGPDVSGNIPDCAAEASTDEASAVGRNGNVSGNTEGEGNTSQQSNVSDVSDVSPVPGVGEIEL